MTAEPADEALAPPSLVEMAVIRLRSEILSGALAPGERIVEGQLTQRFGTSRAPLREALRLLGEQGLVEHLPRRGVRVTRLSPRDIDELFTLRDALEQFAVRCALSGPARLPVDGVRAAVEEMERAAADGDALRKAAAHREFHLALVALAGHHHLMRAYEPVLLRLQLYMATNMRREAEDRSALDGPQRHRRLLDAIESGDVERVLLELHHHGGRTYLAPELRG
ncbi:GntR family transcriptional regulator [Pseudonocardia sp. CA-107938]|uniref:GntR family transcriptional regulator n=1 Tax=Pseudonocardia sp. CA-107938 TaxID=3240021 RepID=UPI003D8D8C3D